MQLTLFHGTNSDFDKFEQSKARIINDFFGGGVAYFTDSRDVALTYAKSMVRSKGGQKFVYEVRLMVNSLFDVDDDFTGNKLTKFFNKKSEIEEFARGAGMMKYGIDKYNIISNVEMGHVDLSGEQVFKGLSMGMNKTAQARQKLIKLGYDTLRYNGGVNINAATKHSVYIAYKASNIHILAKYLYDEKDVAYKKVEH